MNMSARSINKKLWLLPMFSGVIAYWFMYDGGQTKLKNVRTCVGMKHILYYTKFFKHDWHFGEGSEPFIKNSCKVTNCFLTSNRSMLQSLTDFDALIFNFGKMNIQDNITKQLILPEARRSHQRYILYFMEPPVWAIQSLPMNKLKRVFNWTVSFRPTSHVPMPLGTFDRLHYSLGAGFQPPPRRAVDPPPSWLEPDMNHASFMNEVEKNLLFNRPKSVAWLVSHCTSPSRREDYVAILGQHIQVDILGRCGESCGQWYTTECSDRVQRDYKFYLAFENSYCDHYVTEKLFRTMHWNVVPIVMGGANYSEIVPPHSYINVKDFDSPKDLANYLHYLENNQDEYLAFFWWKMHYRVQFGMPVWWRSMCELCRMLNDPSEPAAVIEDIRDTYVCQEPTWTNIESTNPRDF